MKTSIIIPARYASTRFPGKPLIDIRGKAMIQRVYEQASLCKLADSVIVATDDERIFEHVKPFGKVMMTSSTHSTGTERCAELAQQLDADLIINVQGDEPFLHPEQVDTLIRFMIEHKEFSIGTLAKSIAHLEELNSPHTVKVVFNGLHEAIYFSRHAIPFLRDKKTDNPLKQHTFYKHIGMYAYHRKTLLGIAGLSPTPLEQAESLEQLRWLENGIGIGITETTHESVSIDTPEDLEMALELFNDRY